MTEQTNRDGRLSAPTATSAPPVQVMEDAGFGAADILAVGAARKGLFLGATLAGGLLAAGVAFLLPNMYTATAVVITPQKEQSSAAMMIGQLGPLAAAAGADFGLKNPADLYVGLLGSRTIADRLIQKFGLKALYKTKTMTDTRAKLKTRTHFVAGRDSLIKIDVEDVDPQRAATMANTFVSELDEQNRRLAISEASERGEVLERQVAEEKAALADAEEAMKNAQQRTGVLEVNSQTQIAIVALAQLRAQIAAGEVSLQRLRMGATSENPAVLQAETELAVLRAQLLRQEKSSPEGDPLVSTSAIPAAGLSYVRRLRDLKYHETLFELLSKQYEAARIDESRAAPPLQVIDSAIPPDKKSGPHRALISALGLVVGAVVASLVAFFQHYRRSVRSDVPQRTSPRVGA